MQLNFENLEKMIAEKYISVQKHPELDLFIYNYTQKAQFDQVWNNETMQCRGLILDGNKNVIARPFKKFFNLQEILDQGGQIPAEDFIVTEKMDGSLGILYLDSDGRHSLATRGSFVSDQAIRGTKILREKYPVLTEKLNEYTFLFEIIYPENRIVVDYAGMEDIILLSVIKNDTGEELSYDSLPHFGFPVVKKYDAIRDFSQIEQRPNSEGYVIAFPSSKQRFKIKFDEYVRLHRLITGVNARRIWDLLRNHQPLDELLERVPDEFFSWVKNTKEGLEAKYLEIENRAKQIYDEVKDLPTRKDQAIKISVHPERSIVFKMIDKQPYEVIIWQMIKPRHETPFKIEI